MSSRQQFKESDAKDLDRLIYLLNDFALDVYSRLEAIERVKGVTVLSVVTIETGAVVAAGTAPFTADGAGLRVSCPFTPTGLVLLRLQQVRPSPGAVSGTPSDVKWHYASGPAGGAGDGVLHIDYVTGLAASTRYEMTLGVTRA